MICYRDRTFCPATECQKFSSCPSALTESVQTGAELAGLPIARFTNPSALKCYEPAAGIVSEPVKTAPKKQFKTERAAKAFFGNLYDKERCIKVIQEQGTKIPWQCGHPRGKGTKGLWCARHAADNN